MAFPLAALLPYIPHAIGAAGSLYGLLRGGGQPAQTQQLQNFTPQQQNALNALLSQGQQNFNPEAISNQARKQFNQQTVPSLAERFTSLGNNSLSSPAFASQLGQAGAGLEENLAGLRSNMGLQQLQLGLTPQFENLYQQRQPSFFESLSAPAMQALLYYLAGNQSQTAMPGNSMNYSNSRFASPGYSVPSFGNSFIQNLARGL